VWEQDSLLWGLTACSLAEERAEKEEGTLALVRAGQRGQHAAGQPGPLPRQALP